VELALKSQVGWRTILFDIKGLEPENPVDTRCFAYGFVGAFVKCGMIV